METKWCPKNQHWAPLSDFHKNSKTLDGLQGWCKPCMAEYKIADGYSKWQKLMQRYGLTRDVFEAMVHEQDNRCAICLNTFLPNKIFVDHDHSTGFVRGLLCPACNTGIGQFGDDINKMQRAIEYIRRNRG